jgi:hypothetical protein
LGNAEGDKQLEFAQLEQQLVASRLHLERQLEHLSDLQSYARFVIAGSIRLDFGTVLNPDQVTVRSQYVFKVRPHTIQQDNSRSLTEFALCGLHDKSSRARLECVSEIIFGLVFDGVVTAVTALSFVFPPAGIALSVVLFTKETLSGLDALVQGDRAKALKHFVEAIAELVSLGKAAAGKRAASTLQRNFVSLIGDVYKIESFYRQATGHPGLPGLAKEAIQEILDGPQALTSKTTVLTRLVPCHSVAH